jgi:hypothetical protein
MTKARVIAVPYEAEAKRLIACVEVDTPSLMQVCYDVENMTLHHQALWLMEYLAVLKDKLAVIMNKYKDLQKFKQLKEFKQLIEELLKEDRYIKVLEVLFIISYPEILQQLQTQGEEQSKMHT